MVSVAAGLATTGAIPYVATFASFLGLLCCEHIRTDLAYPNLPVRLLGHHAGISLGYYGTSHHATEDIGIMRSIANLTRRDGEEFFAIAPKAGVRTEVTRFPLESANAALQQLRAGEIRGAAVLITS